MTPPVFTFCPPGSDLGCNPGGGVPAPGAATATDDCGTPGITSSLGAVTVSYTHLDVYKRQPLTSSKSGS